MEIRRTLIHSGSLFRLIDPDGQVWEFHDFNQYQSPQGLLARHITAGGQVTEVTYNSGGGIAQVERGDAETIELYQYDYLSLGVNAGRIERITLLRGPRPASDSSEELEEIARVRYTYYGTAEAHGNAGDLKAAIKEDMYGPFMDRDYRWNRRWDRRVPRGDTPTWRISPSPRPVAARSRGPFSATIISAG